FFLGGLRANFHSRMLLLLLAVVIGYIAYVAIGRWIERRVAETRLGEQRRALFPPEVGISPGARELAESPDVELKKELYRIRDGSQIFFHILKPKGKTPTHALVFLHGYSSTGDLYLEFLSELARSGAMVLIPDLPGHGRSDGLLLYIPDWWVFVDQVWTALELVL
ncbi:Caffeoylshikimate esterase, partial [Durusdinium trenchii]